MSESASQMTLIDNNNPNPNELPPCGHDDALRPGVMRFYCNRCEPTAKSPKKKETEMTETNTTGSEPTLEHLDVTMLQIDATIQQRVNLRDDLISEYADAQQNGAVLPPIIVFRDGDDDWVADGFHRCAALIKTGQKAVHAEIRQGSRRVA